MIKLTVKMINNREKLDFCSVWLFFRLDVINLRRNREYIFFVIANKIMYSCTEMSCAHLIRLINVSAAAAAARFLEYITQWSFSVNVYVQQQTLNISGAISKDSECNVHPSQSETSFRNNHTKKLWDIFDELR